jgi:hypothetical protein
MNNINPVSECSIQIADKPMSKRLDDLTGHKFGNLLVIEKAPGRPGNNNTFWIVVCEVCGQQKQVQRPSLLKIKGTGCKQCNHREGKKRELIGKKIDRITVINFIGTDNHEKLLWKVRCDCGAEFEAVTGYIRRRQNAARFACNSCLRKKKDKEWFWSYRIAEMRSNAKSRGLQWALSDEQAQAIMQQSCSYCGSSPTERSRNRQDKDRSMVTVSAGSIDRVDSDLGYSEGNCVPCCDRCNQMKSDLATNDFMDWSQRVYVKHGSEFGA